MSESNEVEEATNQPQSKTWAEFLESSPPSALIIISDLYAGNRFGGWCVAQPDIHLYCESESCNGPRFFQCRSDEINAKGEAHFFFLRYLCRNCLVTTKTFAISARMLEPYKLIPEIGGHRMVGGGKTGEAYKFGEIPAFGPPTPGRVISLIGPDKEHFLRGRRAENQGLGIGAFAYYRRVVENQKGRLIQEIASVAKRLGVDTEILKQFEKAKNETQFSKAIDDIKGAIPQSLLIQGHNPLSLLHKALSEGIHAQSDKECLDIATSIRVVLTELAERISVALKDEAELKQAVSRLLNPPSS
ncbi:MAG: hypothetical protein WCF57_20175 [Pyrinomonadaceae bacterium]